MQIIIYNNKGKTADKYTVFTTSANGRKKFDVYSCSEEPWSPLGVFGFLGEVDGVNEIKNKGVKVKEFYSLPVKLVNYILDRAKLEV